MRIEFEWKCLLVEVYSIFTTFLEVLNFTCVLCLFFSTAAVVIGNCLFAYGRKLGELCRRDADCESGLVRKLKFACVHNSEQLSWFVLIFLRFATCRLPAVQVSAVLRWSLRNNTLRIVHHRAIATSQGERKTFNEAIKSCCDCDNFHLRNFLPFPQRTLLSTSTKTSTSSKKGE